MSYKGRLIVLAGLAAGVAAWFMPLWAAGVWWPDVFSGKENLLASKDLADGHTIRVIQYWSADFCRTELRISNLDGHPIVFLLDRDDGKRWSLPMTVDEAHHTVTVTTRVGEPLNYTWDPLPRPSI